MKALVVLAIRGGTLSRAQARKYYLLSEEELSVWEDRFEIDGLGGLQVKRLRAAGRQSEASATNRK
jgi:hypothetical protein